MRFDERVVNLRAKTTAELLAVVVDHLEMARRPGCCPTCGDDLRTLATIEDHQALVVVLEDRIDDLQRGAAA